METKDFKKITKYDDYTINEFVKGLVKTREDVAEEKGKIEGKIEVGTKKIISLQEELVKEDANKEIIEQQIEEINDELSNTRKEQEQIEKYLKKWEEEKERINQKLEEKIATFEERAKENETKIEENESKIAENEEKMKEMDEDSLEYNELAVENIKLNKQISRYRGNITRYNNKINHIKEVQGNLKTENILDLKPPIKIKSKARTLTGKRTRKIEEPPVLIENNDTEIIPQPKKVINQPAKGPVKSEILGEEITRGEERVETDVKKVRVVEKQIVTNTKTPDQLTQEQLVQLLKRQQSKREIEKIEVDPMTLAIKYFLKNDKNEKIAQGLVYDEKRTKEAYKTVKQYLPKQKKLRKTINKLDSNIVKLIIDVCGEKGASEHIEQYVDALLGKKQSNSKFSIVYNLKDIYKSNLTYAEIKKIIKIAKKAERASNGIVKMERDPLFKRIFENITRRISPRKLLADNRRNEQIAITHKKNGDFIPKAQSNEAEARAQAAAKTTTAPEIENVK